MQLERGRLSTPRMSARVNHSEQDAAQAPYVDFVRVLGLAIDFRRASMYWAKTIVRCSLGLNRFTEIAQDCFWWFRAHQEQISRMNVPMNVSGSMKSREAQDGTSKAVPNGR